MDHPASGSFGSVELHHGLNAAVSDSQHCRPPRAGKAGRRAFCLTRVQLSTPKFPI